MTVLQRIAGALSDDALVSNLTKLSAQLDDYAALKLNVDDPALHQDNLIVAALRAEYRTRTGEVI